MGHTEAHTPEEMEYERLLAGATHQRAVADVPSLRPSGSEMEEWYSPTTPFGRTATGAARTRSQREEVIRAQQLAGGGIGGNILEFLPRTNLAKGGQVIDLSGLLPGEMQSIFGATPEETLARGPRLSKQLQRGVERQQRFAQFRPALAPTAPYWYTPQPRIGDPSVPMDPGSQFNLRVDELLAKDITVATTEYERSLNARANELQSSPDLAAYELSFNAIVQDLMADGFPLLEAEAEATRELGPRPTGDPVMTREDAIAQARSELGLAPKQLTREEAIAQAMRELGLSDAAPSVLGALDPDRQAFEFARYQAGARGVPAVTGPGGQPAAPGPEGLPPGFFGPPGVTPDDALGAVAAPGVAPVETAADGRPVAPAAAQVPWAQRNDLFELFSGEEIGATGSETGTIKDLRAEGLSAAGRAGTLSDTAILKAQAWLRDQKTQYEKKDRAITVIQGDLDWITAQLAALPDPLAPLSDDPAIAAIQLQAGRGESPELTQARADLMEAWQAKSDEKETYLLDADKQENRYKALLQVLTGAEADQKVFEAELKTQQTEWDSAQTRAGQQAARLAVFNEVVREVYTGLSPEVFSSLAPATQTALMASARREVLARETAAAKTVAKTDPNAWRADALVELGKLFPEAGVSSAIFDLPTGLLNFLQGREVTEPPPETGTRSLTTIFR